MYTLLGCAHIQYLTFAIGCHCEVCNCSWSRCYGHCTKGLLNLISICAKKNEPSEPRQARMTCRLYITCSCTDTSNSTLLINNLASSSLSLPHPVTLLSQFDPCILSLILRPYTPQHTHIFHYPSYSCCCHLHSILAKTLLFKFTLLWTSVNPSCFPSDLKPS